MLNAGSGKPIKALNIAGAVDSSPLHLNGARSVDHRGYTRDRQAALFAVNAVLAYFLKHRVDADKRVGFALFPACVHYEHAHHCTHLRGRKPAARGGIHGFKHICGKGLHIGQIGHRRAGFAQSRIGPQDDRQNAHGRASSRFSLTMRRVISWRFMGFR